MVYSKTRSAIGERAHDFASCRRAGRKAGRTGLGAPLRQDTKLRARRVPAELAAEEAVEEGLTCAKAGSAAMDDVATKKIRVSVLRTRKFQSMPLGLSACNEAKRSELSLTGASIDNAFLPEQRSNETLYITEVTLEKI